MFRNKNIKMRYLILGSVVSFLLGAGVVILYINKLITQALFMIGLFILLLIFSSCTSAIFNRLIMKRINKKKKTRKFKVTTNTIDILDAEIIETNYGKVYLRNISKTMYSLTVVDKPEIFFSDEASNLKSRVESKKFSRSIQFYVFDSSLYDYYNKISVFNYQAKNFYIASFLYDKNNQILKQADNVLPNEEFSEYVEKFHKMMGLVPLK